MCFCFFDPFVSDKPWDLSRNGLVQHHIREALSSIKDAVVLRSAWVSLNSVLFVEEPPNFHAYNQGNIVKYMDIYIFIYIMCVCVLQSAYTHMYIYYI